MARQHEGGSLGSVCGLEVFVAGGGFFEVGSSAAFGEVECAGREHLLRVCFPRRVCWDCSAERLLGAEEVLELLLGDGLDLLDEALRALAVVAVLLGLADDFSDLRCGERGKEASHQIFSVAHTASTGGTAWSTRGSAARLPARDSPSSLAPGAAAARCVLRR